MSENLTLLEFLEAIKAGEHCWTDDDIVRWIAEAKEAIKKGNPNE